MKTSNSVSQELYSAINALAEAKAKLHLLIRKKEGKEKVEKSMAEVDRYLAEIIPTTTKVAIYLATAKKQQHEKVMDIEGDGFYHMACNSLNEKLHWLENAPNKSSVTRSKNMKT